MIITIFDALGIQDYLFNSNRLAENLGASFLVEQALGEWPIAAAQEVAPRKVNPSSHEAPPAIPGILAKGPYDIERAYAAGGNAVFLVKDQPTAKKLATAFSKILQQYAPGLSICCVHHLIEVTAFDLFTELKKAFSLLAMTKANRTSSSRCGSHGVTELCFSGTEEPAINSDPSRSNRFLGPAALAKIHNRALATERLRNFLNNAIPGDCTLPLELDDLGRSRGQKSFIGVVHIDGNNIGKNLQAIINRSCTDNNQALAALRNFSEEVSLAGTMAVRNVMKQVAYNWKPTEKLFAGAIKLNRTDDGFQLPFRPIVFGGDDITFVCDGRIALDLAATCIKAFHAGSSTHRHACAGVALVKAHFPFATAYMLAEELCGNAKEFLRRENNPSSASAIDWHIHQGGPFQSIGRIRENQYVAQDGKKLTLRPYMVLPENDKDCRDWKGFRDRFLHVFQTKEPWVSVRSRLKEQLSGVLPLGGQPTSELLLDWKNKDDKKNKNEKLMLPEYFGQSLAGGFYADETPCLDALELLDHFVPLHEEDAS